MNYFLLKQFVRFCPLVRTTILMLFQGQYAFPRWRHDFHIQIHSFIMIYNILIVMLYRLMLIDLITQHHRDPRMNFGNQVIHIMIMREHLKDQGLILLTHQHLIGINLTISLSQNHFTFITIQPNLMNFMKIHVLRVYLYQIRSVMEHLGKQSQVIQPVIMKIMLSFIQIYYRGTRTL